MRQFAKNLISEWRKLKLPTTENVCVVAVSGGADSVSLLAALDELQAAEKLNLKFIVAHFNHQLRGAESEADADFVRKLAAKFNFEFICQTPESELNNLKDNLEQAARNARYNFLRETAAAYKAFAVLTGHTLDDQAETFLLRLLRGSGADGLGAMDLIRDLKSEIRNPKSAIRLVRPLLSWARREMTEAYCRETGLEFRCDAMNDDEHFARVRVRKELVPLLKTFNPKIIETLANTAELLREDAAELNAQAEKFLSENNFSLLTAHCSLLTSALRRRVLRIWLKKARGDLRRIDAKHLRALETLILNPAGNRKIELPGGGIVTRRNGRLNYCPPG